MASPKAGSMRPLKTPTSRKTQRRVSPTLVDTNTTSLRISPASATRYRPGSAMRCTSSPKQEAAVSVMVEPKSSIGDTSSR